MAEKYYAVKYGAASGIFRSWEECRKAVHGVSGAIYKSFKTEGEALNYLKEEMVDFSEKEKILTAYVDGSYFCGSEFGAGCVFLQDERIVETRSVKFEDEELALMKNVAGEIKASELAMSYAREKGYKYLEIYYDYEGIARWPLKEWTAKKTGTRAYKDFYDEVSKEIRIVFRKVEGHSGNKYNDMADELAKSAIDG